MSPGGKELVEADHDMKSRPAGIRRRFDHIQ